MTGLYLFRSCRATAHPAIASVQRLWLFRLLRPVLPVLLAAVLLPACSSDEETSDAYGNFEATEITVSAEAGGELLRFAVQEGETLDAGAVVGLIDTTQAALKREQLLAQRAAVASRVENVLAQIAVLREQKQVALHEQERVRRLLQDSAATQKQYDDITGSIAVLNKQIAQIETQNRTVLSEVRAVDAQIAQLDDQVDKSTIVNPVAGTVLTTFADEHEFVAPGRPLYTIANLDEMTLRVYVSGGQLPQVKLGDTVTVLFDRDAETNQSTRGRVSWISSKAEFTPRIIQTKEERVNMVYAVRVRVKNDGRLKIGMPGEIRLQQTNEQMQKQ